MLNLIDKKTIRTFITKAVYLDLLHVSLPLGSVDRLCSKTCVKRSLSKRQQIGFQYQLSLNAGQKYCRMLQAEHSAILSTFIKLPVVIKIFFFYFEWPLYTCFTVI